APHRRVVLAYSRNVVRPKALTSLRTANLQSQQTGVTFVNE
ncbi:hydrogen peroxide-inducible genes activator, partial [Neisseria sp. P0014.S006]